MTSPPAGTTVPRATRLPGGGLGAWSLALLLLALFAWLLWPGLRANTPTADEFAHVPAGYAYWRGAPLSVYQNSPPLGRLLLAAPLLLADPPPRVDLASARTARSGWRPWAFAHRFMQLNHDRYFELFFRARLVSVALGVLGGLVVFAWSRHLFGPPGGLVSLFLYVLSPEVLAHAGLATTDIAFAVAWTAALLFWALFLERPGWTRLLAASLAASAAALLKHSGPLLLPLFAVSAALTLRSTTPALPPLDRLGPRWRRLATGLVALGAAAASLCLLAVALYGPAQAPTRLDEVAARGRTFRSLGGSPLGRVPLPLPHGYLAGLDSQLRDAEETPSYLRGRWAPRGQRSYFVVAFLVKTPIPVLLLVATPFLFPSRWGDGGRRARAWVTLLVPAAVYVAAVSLSNMHLGLRYALPAYLLALVLAGASAEVAARSPVGLRVGGALLLGWLLGATVLARPHFLPYFNEAAGGMKGGDRFLVDSNIDWGQDLGRLADWLKARRVAAPIDLLYFGHVDPALYGIAWRVPPPVPPGPGERRPLTVASVNFVRGYAYRLTYAEPPRDVGPDAYRWLGDYEPIDRVGGSLLVYDLDPRRLRKR